MPVLTGSLGFLARRDRCSSRFRCAEGAGERRSGGASHGVGVEVVGEDRPRAPRAAAGGAFEAAAAHAVVALEVTDAAFGAGAVAVQSSAGAIGVRRGRVGVPHGYGLLRAVLERLDGDVLAEPAVDGGLTNADPLRVQAREGRGQQLVLTGVARGGAGRQDVPARAGRVLGDLAHLVHVPELGALGELALADRAGIGVVQRDEPIGDRLAREPQPDLLRHAPTVRQERLEALRCALLRLPALLAQVRAKTLRFGDRQTQRIAQLTGNLQDFLL